jgi:hypothetical protein
MVWPMVANRKPQGSKGLPLLNTPLRSPKPPSHEPPPALMSAAVAPSPEAAAESRKRRWQGECEEAVPKRRYADARRALDWLPHLCARYPGMSDKARARASRRGWRAAGARALRRAAWAWAF